MLPFEAIVSKMTGRFAVYAELLGFVDVLCRNTVFVTGVLRVLCPAGLERGRFSVRFDRRGGDSRHAVKKLIKSIDLQSGGRRSQRGATDTRKQ